MLFILSDIISLILKGAFFQLLSFFIFKDLLVFRAVWGSQKKWEEGIEIFHTLPALTHAFNYSVVSLQRRTWPFGEWGSGKAGRSDLEQSSKTWVEVIKAKDSRNQQEQHGPSLWCKVVWPVPDESPVPWAQTAKGKQGEGRLEWKLGSDHTEPHGPSKNVGLHPKSSEKS